MEKTISLSSQNSLPWPVRMVRFINQMFPPFPAQVAVLGSFILNYLMLAKFFAHTKPVMLEIVLGGVSQVLMNLLLRAMDEIKDYKTDVINFPSRPLVVGLITHKDLYILITMIVGSLIVLQVPFVGRPVIAAFAAAIVFSFLMFKWFFAEDRIRASLPLALVTHHPVVFLFQLYTLSFFMGTHPGGLGGLPPHAMAFIFGIATSATAWEISRKMRGTAQEDTYTTYTKIWGIVPAGLVLIALVTASLAVSFYSISQVTDSMIVRGAWALPALAWLVVVINVFRFFGKRDVAPQLKQLVESFALCLLLASLVAVCGV